MLRSCSLFSQLLRLFSRPEFESAVRHHGGDRYVKRLSCWDQFVSMLFCQLAQAHSLREICGGLRCCHGKLNHLGLDAAPKRSTLSYANAHRPWEIYQAVFYQLLARCKAIAPGHRFRFRNKLYSLDASVIDLALSLFEWARFTQTKGAVKLHLLLDHDGYLPQFAHITEGKVADLVVARQLELPAGSIVAMDRGYNDFKLFSRWTEDGVYFVTRLKRGTNFLVVDLQDTTRDRGVISDKVVRLRSDQGQQDCPHPLRVVVFHDEESGRTFEFLTNNFKLSPVTIARIYRERWQIELFFKALKQNLRIKTFVGTSANALKTQIWTALIAILLLKYLHLRSRSGWSLSTLVALLRWNLFTHRDLERWLDDPFAEPPEPSQWIQMELRW
jgi:hypothetical protein